MSQEGRHVTRKFRAFTIIELITVVATMVVLSAFLLPALAKSQSQTHSAIDMSNVRQILKAVHTYSGDNGDFLPHPTWGTQITGWAYSAGIRDGALGSPPLRHKSPRWFQINWDISARASSRRF